MALLLAYVVLHAISNLSNDYFGYRQGHDTADSPRRRYTLHPIASGAVTTRLLVSGLGSPSRSFLDRGGGVGVGAGAGQGTLVDD
ncbi:MAG: hypothetical protein ABJB98_03105 [Actinomycetota bacterium]